MGGLSRCTTMQISWAYSSKIDQVMAISLICATESMSLSAGDDPRYKAVFTTKNSSLLSDKSQFICYDCLCTLIASIVCMSTLVS